MATIEKTVRKSTMTEVVYKINKSNDVIFTHFSGSNVVGVSGHTAGIYRDLKSIPVEEFKKIVEKLPLS